jgi:endonuclease G, mitochondrial
MQFGKFASFEAFLESYTQAERERSAREGFTLEEARGRARRARERDVVEVRGTLHEVLGTEEGTAAHQHLLIRIGEVVEGDSDVERDLQRVKLEQENVFVSVRYGDRNGLPEAIPGLAAGQVLHLRGEWIPRDKAYAHDGERLSVLHFTHHPLGFVCTEARCYS